MTNAVVRVPELEDPRSVKLVNGPEAFTPDGEFILGETDVRGFWVAAGFCAHGLAGAGAWGSSSPSGSSRASRVSTSGRWTRAASALRTRVATTRSPARWRSTRPTTTSSTRATSARPAVRCAFPRRTSGCASSAPRSARSRVGSVRTGSSPTPRGGTSCSGRAAGPAACGRRPSAWSIGRARDGRAFRRELVRQAGRARVRRRRVPRAPQRQSRRTRRRSGHLHADAERARGIECDFTGHAPGRGSLPDRDRYGVRAARLRPGSARHAPDDGSVVVQDVTSRFACLGLWGRPRDLLQPLTEASLGNDAFPYMRAGAQRRRRPCLAARVTYVGELGWELYCPTEFGRRLWDTIWEAGPSTASSPAATRRSTRSGWRRATASGAPTSPRTRRRTRPGSASPSSWTRATSSAARRSLARRRRSAGSPASSSTTFAPSPLDRSPFAWTVRSSAG